MGLLDDEVESLRRSWRAIKGLGKTFNNNPANREFMDATFGLGGIAPGVNVPSAAAEYAYRLGQRDYLGAGLAGLGMIPGAALVTKAVKGAKPLTGILDDIVRDVPKSAKQKALDTIKGDVVGALDRSRGNAFEGRGPQSGPFAMTEVGQSPLGRNAKSRFALKDKSVAADGGLASPDFIELHDTPAARKMFADSGRRARDAIGPQGAQVNIYDKSSEYAGSRLFMTEDGTVGFAIKPDGDIVSVFKHPDSGPGGNVGSVATLLATQEGGRKLDAFDTYLPEKIYGPAGYEHRSGLPFNTAEAPPSWDYAKNGTPNVTMQAFTPGNPTPYKQAKVNGLLGPNDYMEAMSARDRSGIWTPELTPGVSRQLHGAVVRPSRGGRTTVISPSRKAFERIYDDPRILIEDAARKIAPENPDMLKHFGASRQDLDDMTRMNQGQMARNNIEIPVYSPTGRSAVNEYAPHIMGAANTTRLQDLLSLSAADPRFAGSYGWYMLEPLRAKYVEALGEVAGNKAFDDFMQMGSALSARSSPVSEIRRASLANEYMHTRPDGLRQFYESAGDALPNGYGSLAHSSAHRNSLRRFKNTGMFFDDASMLEGPKTPNYYYSKTGENIMYPTGDAHFSRFVGLSDARPMMNGYDASLSKEEAGMVRDYFRNQVAAPLGMEGSPAQALMWNAGSQATGVQGNIGKPYLELITDAIGRQSRYAGRSFEDTLYDFIRGQTRLRQMAPVGGAAAMYGLLSGDEDEGGI